MMIKTAKWILVLSGFIGSFHALYEIFTGNYFYLIYLGVFDYVYGSIVGRKLAASKNSLIRFSWTQIVKLDTIIYVWPCFFILLVPIIYVALQILD